MMYLYPLRNLTTDIPKQLQAFFAHIGRPPKCLITDFDLKLNGGKAREFLNNMLIHVNAAPSYRQDKNGLVERHWQTMVSMARSWLASAELPSTFWYYAVNRAAEPDLRVFFKLFSLAAVHRERLGDDKLSKFDSQSVPMIAIGRCSNSNGLLFYNPTSGTIVSSIDYVLQPNVTSGARFRYRY
jgi:hypothetical protein